jgi:hypothetical protein
MFLLSKIAIHLHKAKGQEKPLALKREHLALQNQKFLPFFLFLNVIFALLDPDPADKNQCGSESETLNTLHHIVS